MGILGDCQKAPDLPQDFSDADKLDGRYKLSKQNEPGSVEPLRADGNQTVYEYFIQSPVSDTSMTRSRADNDSALLVIDSASY